MKKAMILMAASLMLGASFASAHGDEEHMGGHHNPCSMQGMNGMGGMQHMKGMNPCSMHDMKGMFLKKKVIDGYEVSFHIMKAPEGMAHGGTHHLMVKVEHDGAIVGLQAVNSKIVHPNGKSESKMMMKMGDWYMAGYDLGHEGAHQVMVLFKTKDGKKHFGGVKYSGTAL